MASAFPWVVTLPKPNSHVYGENGAKIMVYNIKRNPKKGEEEKSREKVSSRKITEKGKTSYLGSDYSG